MQILRVLIIFFMSFNVAQSIGFKELNSGGLNFWFVEDNSIPIISLSFTFEGGSSLDPVGKEGLINLMTSLMDEGTSKFDSKEIKQLMKSNGIKLNLKTSKNRVDGTFQVISSQRDQGFKLLAEILEKPSFKIAEIKKVKDQLNSSIKIDKSNISTIANQKFDEFFFKNHRFSRNIKGTIDSLEKISREDLKKFHKKIFNTNSLHIGVAGDISEKEIKKYIGIVFGNLPLSKPTNFEKFTNLPIGKKIVNIETPQSSVVFGHPGISRNHKDYFSFRIANYVLGGGGFQSRLYKEIREKRGLVYSIYSYPMSYKHDGVMIGGFQTQNDTVNKTIAGIKKEWSKITKRGISEKELDEAKAYYKGSFTRNFTSTLSIASLLNTIQFYNLGNDYFDRRGEIIDKLNLKKVNKMIDEQFDSEKLFFLVVGKPK